MIRYWFSGTSVALLVLAAMGMAGAVTLSYVAPRPPGFPPLVEIIGGVIALIAVYGIIRRRHAVARFNLIFGFMPSPVRSDVRFRHLVENEIRARAEVLRTAYGERDTRRDARRMAANATAASSLQRDYELADRIVDSCYRRFYKAIDAATSKWLPTPYSKISREYTEWVSGRVPTHSF